MCSSLSLPFLLHSYTTRINEPLLFSHSILDLYPSQNFSQGISWLYHYHFLHTHGSNFFQNWFSFIWRQRKRQIDGCQELSANAHKSGPDLVEARRLELNTALRYGYQGAKYMSHLLPPWCTSSEAAVRTRTRAQIQALQLGMRLPTSLLWSQTPTPGAIYLHLYVSRDVYESSGRWC